MAALQFAEATSRPTSVDEIFTASTYLVQTKVTESYRSHPRTDLGIFYELSTFEIKEPSGMLVARFRHMHEPLPSSVFNLSRLSSLRAYSMETPEGVQIGELRGPAMLIPNRPYLQIKDAHGQEIASIIMKVEKKLGAGFFSIGVTTWVVAKPSGEELARINWGKTGRDWTIETPQVQKLEVQDPEYQTSHEVKILNPAIPPYIVLATFLATPSGTK